MQKDKYKLAFTHIERTAGTSFIHILRHNFFTGGACNGIIFFPLFQFVKVEPVTYVQISHNNGHCR